MSCPCGLRYGPTGFCMDCRTPMYNHGALCASCATTRLARSETRSDTKEAHLGVQVSTAGENPAASEPTCPCGKVGCTVLIAWQQEQQQEYDKDKRIAELEAALRGLIKPTSSEEHDAARQQAIALLNSPAKPEGER